MVNKQNKFLVSNLTTAVGGIRLNRRGWTQLYNFCSGAGRCSTDRTSFQCLTPQLQLVERQLSVWDGPCLVAFVTPIKQDFILRLQFHKKKIDKYFCHNSKTVSLASLSIVLFCLVFNARLGLVRSKKFFERTNCFAFLLSLK